MLAIAAAAPAGTFFDFSPVQFVTSASLARVGAAHPSGRVEAVRYRPNIIIETVPGLPGFVENDWAGHRLHIGPDVILGLRLGALPRGLRHGGGGRPGGSRRRGPTGGLRPGVPHSGRRRYRRERTLGKWRSG